MSILVNSYPSLVVEFFFFSFLMKEFTLAFKKLRIEWDTNDSYKVIMCNKIIYYIP